MAVPRTEVGLALLLIGLLWGLNEIPPERVELDRVDMYEGRKVRVAGFVQDVEGGSDEFRGVLVVDGHALKFTVQGTDEPEDGDWMELDGVLQRYRGELLLRVESPPWKD